MILALTGIGVNSGIATGKVHRLAPGELEIPEYHLDEADIRSEISRLHGAVSRVEAYLNTLQVRLDEQTGKTALEFLEAHRMMLRDDMLLQAACDRIQSGQINAEWALASQREFLLNEFDRMEDDYLSARREDVDQVVQLVQRELAEQPTTLITERIPHRLEDTVVVAGSLSPADLAILHQRKVAGLVTEHGSPWAHAAIVARSLEIPTVVGVHRACSVLREDERVILDGHYGVVLAGSDEAIARHYRDKQADTRRHRAELNAFIQRPSRTADSKSFSLQANAEFPAEIERAHRTRADAVGLMRTEYLFMQPSLPDENEQYATYRAAVEAMGGRSVTIRTLDAGSDKLPPGLGLMPGPNPALGLRGLRLSLSMPEIFCQQIMAILRAASHGPVRILLPMVTTCREIRRVRELIAECRESLRTDGHKTDPDIALGGMIEVPAAAIAIETLAEELDFLSVGTNDLIQYLLAIDRQDELVNHLYNPCHPAVLETLSRIVRVSRERKRPLAICGEIAGDLRYSRLLLGLGFTGFSMPPARLLAVKKVLLGSHARRCREIVGRYMAGGVEGRESELLDELENKGGG